jgi:hypothetical protein
MIILFNVKDRKRGIAQKDNTLIPDGTQAGMKTNFVYNK